MAQLMFEFCNQCEGRNKSVFRCLTPEQQELLREKFETRSVEKGGKIFSEGDAPKGLICLSSGKVKVFKEGVGHREQIVRMAKPVAFIGYRALFAEELHQTTAVALEKSRICIFHRESLFNVMYRNARLSMNIIKALALELGFTQNRTVSLTQKHLRGRLAEALLFLIDTYGFELDGHTLNINLSREDLAGLSSMNTSNAIRTLSGFAAEGLVTLNAKKIIINKRDELQRISEAG